MKWVEVYNLLWNSKGLAHYTVETCVFSYYLWWKRHALTWIVPKTTRETLKLFAYCNGTAKNLECKICYLSFRNSPPEVILWKGVLKIYIKYTAERPWRSAILMKKQKKYCQFAYANNYVYPFFHISARQV